MSSNLTYFFTLFDTDFKIIINYNIKFENIEKMLAGGGLCYNVKMDKASKSNLSF